MFDHLLCHRKLVFTAQNTVGCNVFICVFCCYVFYYVGIDFPCVQDRPSTKVHSAPGGGSSLDYLFGGPGGNWDMPLHCWILWNLYFGWGNAFHPLCKQLWLLWILWCNIGVVVVGIIQSRVLFFRCINHLIQISLSWTKQHSPSAYLVFSVIFPVINFC